MRAFSLACALQLITMMSFSQDCKGFYLLTRDAEIIMSVYDAKGNENGKQIWKVDELGQAGAAWQARVKSQFIDKKGKEVTKAEGSYKCDGGSFKADMKMAMPQQQMEAYKDMEVKADEVYIDYPAKMSEGQSLADANFKMEVYNKGMLQTKISFKEFNRKVAGMEMVTSAAGTWNAVKISYDAQFSISVGGTGIEIPTNMKINEWFAPGFGVVKTETYNKNGKLMGSTLITSFKK